MVQLQAHEIEHPDRLDIIARKLFGKSYIRLLDAEAAEVWRVIDSYED